MLSSIITQNPWLGSTYQRQGYVFPQKGHSKSAASLFATPENGFAQHYLFWGDGSIGKKICILFLSARNCVIFE